MQQNDWNYCALVQDPRDGRLYMAHLIENRWKVMREITQIIEGEIVTEGAIVS